MKTKNKSRAKELLPGVKEIKDGYTIDYNRFTLISFREILIALIILILAMIFSFSFIGFILVIIFVIYVFFIVFRNISQYFGFLRNTFKYQFYNKSIVKFKK
jgi:hypothetical protein